MAGAGGKPTKELFWKLFSARCPAQKNRNRPQTHSFTGHLLRGTPASFAHLNRFDSACWHGSPLPEKAPWKRSTPPCDPAHLARGGAHSWKGLAEKGGAAGRQGRGGRRGCACAMREARAANLESPPGDVSEKREDSCACSRPSAFLVARHKQSGLQDSLLGPFACSPLRAASKQKKPSQQKWEGKASI